MVVRRVFIAGFMLVGLLTLGTVGYMLVEGWGFMDALYMTVTTVGTVGFREVHKLSRAGETFTMVLIILGAGALGFSLGVLVDFFAEGRFFRLLEERRMTSHINALRGHHVIAGLGAVGAVVAESLADEDKPFVVIDMQDDAIAMARERGWLYVQGDATQEPVLIAAGVKQAHSLITALDRDGANMFVTVTAKTLNPSLFVVSRSESEAAESVLLKAGVDRVITPNVIGGRRMANMVTHPLVSDYLDLVTHGRAVQFRLQDFELPATSPLANKSIREGMVRDRYGVYILAVREPDGSVDTNPSMDKKLVPGSVLVMLGTPQQLESLVHEA